MDSNVVTLVFGIVVVIAIIVFLVFFRKHSSVRGSMKGPGGIEASFQADGRTEQSRGVTQTGIKGRNVSAIDATGQNIVQEEIDANGDVSAKLTSTNSRRSPKKA